MNRVLRGALLLLLGGGLALAYPPVPLLADDHGKIRMYRLNKKGQLLKQRWLRGMRDPGCHNTMKARKVHRFAQVGYAYCQLFSAKNCTDGSEVMAMWKGKHYQGADFDMEQPQQDMPRGGQWYLHESENVVIRSWACFYPDPETAAETASATVFESAPETAPAATPETDSEPQ